MKTKPEFKYFTEFCGEVTLYRSKDEFRTVRHRVCHRLKDLKPISEIYRFRVVKLWSVKDGDFVDQGRSFNHQRA